jgi:hypothetical protein
MVFGSVLSSSRGKLSHRQALELADIYLDHVGKTQDNDIVMVLCHDTEDSLHQAGKTAKHSRDNKNMRQDIATGYIKLGRALATRGYLTEAGAFYKKAEKLG